MPPIDASTAAPRQPRLRLAIALALGVAVVATAIGLAVRAHDYHQLVSWTDAQATPTVDLITPQAGAEAPSMSLPGNLSAWVDAPIHARVSGYLKNWYVDIGGKVKAGDLLGEIDTPELDQQQSQARANLVKAQADAKLAQITAKRWNNLLATNSVSKQEADEKNGEAESANASVKAAQAALDRISAFEAFKKVVAPFSGTVTSRNVDIGDLVSADNNSSPPLFSLADTHKMRLYVSVPQSLASSIHPGMHVELGVLEHPGTTFKATLIGNSGAINGRSGSQQAQFEVENPDGALMPGDYAEVRLPVASQPGVFTVPATVLLFRNAGPQVAVLGADNRVALRDIHIAQDLGTSLQIDQGLQAGDRIVDHPPDSLNAGDRVRIASSQTEGGHADAKAG